MDRVQLDELIIRDFRNIERASVRPGSRFNVIHGPNGSGKTNAIEAIYLLGALRSFRTKRRAEIVRRGSQAATVEGVFGQVNKGMALGFHLLAEGRKVTVDGAGATPGSDHFRKLPMVLFHPGNMEIVQGGPEGRRRFVDRALFQAEPTYPEVFRGYRRALASRNMLLRERNPDPRAIGPFDLQLANLAERIVTMRQRFVDSMSPLFAAAVEQVSGKNTGGVSYRPKIEGPADRILEALDESLPLDSSRGYTSVGPHGDDLRFEVDGLDARKFASQGQQRTAVLAAKIAETKALESAAGRTPLLLLDDVSSELDRDRNRKLFEFLSTVGGQVFITTTHSDYIAVEQERIDFSVLGGVLKQAE